MRRKVLVFSRKYSKPRPVFAAPWDTWTARPWLINWKNGRSRKSLYVPF